MEKQTKIFLVDDDLFSLNVYRQELQNLGYEDVSLFLNGNICLSNLYKKPEIIFLDHQMDDLTGFEALKKIKRYDPNIYVVMVSGQENMEVAIDALKYGAFDYIIKGDTELKRMEEVLMRIESINKEIAKTNPTLIQTILSLFDNPKT